MKMNHPLESFQKEAPEIQKSYAQVIDSIIALKSLDKKTKQLIYIGMKVVTDDKNAVYYHVPIAKQAGASRDEIKETIILSLTVTGLKNIGNFLAYALEIYDNVEGEYRSLLGKRESLIGEKQDVLVMMNEIETKKKDNFTCC